MADARDQVEIQVRHNQFVLVATRLCDDLPPRIAEVASPIKLSDVPGEFMADAIDRTHKITIRHGMCRLFQFPEILGESCYRGRRIEDDLGAVQSQDAGSLGKVSIVTGIDTAPRSPS